MNSESKALEVEIFIDGMTCKGCATKVENALKTADGCEDAVVDLPNAKARVRIDTSVTSPKVLAALVTDLGYPARLEATQQVAFPVIGMNCNGCAKKVARLIKEIDGVASAEVSLDDARATVLFDPAKTTQTKIMAMVADAGYPAKAKGKLPPKLPPSNEQKNKEQAALPASVIDSLETMKIGITGMTCSSCAGRVEKALSNTKGIDTANVNLALENAVISYDPAKTNAEEIKKVVKDAGYGTTGGEQTGVQTVKLLITGMTCASCSGRVEVALNAVTGVRQASVNLALENAVVSYDGDKTDIGAIITAVIDAGYGASVAQDDAADQAEVALKRERLMLIASILLSLPLLGQMLSMFFGVGYHLNPWVEVALATPVQFIIGARFYKGAWNALKNAAGNMDLLVAMGTSAAYFFSLWRVFGLGEGAQGLLYFEVSALVITLILVGKYMESRAKRSASAALRKLMGLRPTNAVVLRDGAEVDTPIEAVRIGDTVLLRPGARVPVDGTIILGDSELDESLITGESMPVLRRVGDRVIAGSINGGGVLKLRTDKVGSDTTLAKVAAMVEEAQVGKAPIQRLVDRISAIFVPIVIAIAAATFTGWMLSGASVEHALMATISVLVIACPCALGLATPTALVAGTGAAARSGVLIRDIETLERARAIDTVVFDKTGTLTIGQPEVVAIHSFGMDESDLLALAARVQAGSEHPLGKAVVAAAKARGLEIGQADNIRATAGEGISGEIEGKPVAMGRARFAVNKVVDATQQQAADALREGGRTVVWLARDGKALGVFALADTIRPEATEAIEDLHKRRVKTVLMTGDNAATAAKVAGQVGIDQVIADMRPEDKAGQVAELGRAGAHVAMVGDGVNDAPALAQADLGIAMGGGADVAVETAGFVLMRPDPRLVGAALDIANKTGTKIRQNLFWAFAYNVICIPIAAAGYLSPALAGAAMAASSVFVVSNSVLLKRWKVRN